MAEIKYLYIPYYSVSDSMADVTDDELKKYLREHQAEYQVEGHKLQYVNLCEQVVHHVLHFL